MGVWIMPATVALSLSLMVNALGAPEFPGITMNGGTLFGLPVIVSEHVPTVSAGAYVFLVNAGDIYLGDDGDISIDMSREASLEMDDADFTQDQPTGSTLVSLWQNNLVGFLAERTINWKKRRDGAVAALSEVNWGSLSS
jgi:HK97 family phage major capsid protein